LAAAASSALRRARSRGSRGSRGFDPYLDKHDIAANLQPNRRLEEPMPGTYDSAAEAEIDRAQQRAQRIELAVTAPARIGRPGLVG
jgi:hypothetical protein